MLYCAWHHSFWHVHRGNNLGRNPPLLNYSVALTNFMVKKMFLGLIRNHNKHIQATSYSQSSLVVQHELVYFIFGNCIIHDFARILRYCRNPWNVVFKMLSTLKGPRMALLKIQTSHFQTQMSYGWRRSRTRRVVFTTLVTRLSAWGNPVTSVPLKDSVLFSD